MVIASSRRVHTSLTLISRVGYRLDGRMSHQSFVASSMRPAPTRISTNRSYSPQEANSCGIPVRGRFWNMTRR